jgi:hypothetical protein
MSATIADIGCDLVKSSRLANEFSAQRGLINELFPYVYEASERMSSRAISRWLAEKGVKLSPATIAKALRKPDPYWQELADEIEPSAMLFGKCHEIDVQDLLTNGEAFSVLAEHRFSPTAVSDDDVRMSLNEIQAATDKLKNDWFALPESAREACLANADWSFFSEQAARNEKTAQEKK